jgi:hypothetical protein
MSDVRCLKSEVGKKKNRCALQVEIVARNKREGKSEEKMPHAKLAKARRRARRLEA